MLELMAGRASEAQAAAFLVSVQVPTLSAEELQQYAAAVLDYAVPVAASAGAQGLTDIVGTGGDGLDTFNVSTAGALVVAACGARVAKHGNRSSSGSVGSADFLEVCSKRSLR